MIGLYRLINYLFGLLDLAILIRVLLSWLRPDPWNPLVRLVYQITDPILAPLRRIIPPIAGLDITPMVALILIDFARRIVFTLLF
jgi:YggT family protein